MNINRDLFIASAGGPDAVEKMDSETRADALELYALRQLDANAVGPREGKLPTVAAVEAQIETRNYRRGVGTLFLPTQGEATVRKLTPMPENPTLFDFFRLRFAPANHVLQSARLAQKNGMSDEIVLACLLHDTAQTLVRADHGYWAGQLYDPYVPEKTSFAIRYHQVLRFFPDPEAGYEYPNLYRVIFGEDYVPPPHVQAAHDYVRNHRWYMEARMVTVNDLYAFDPQAEVRIDPFEDIIGRHFRQPEEGLGKDNSPVAHMWRTIANPDAPL